MIKEGGKWLYHTSTLPEMYNPDTGHKCYKDGSDSSSSASDTYHTYSKSIREGFRERRG